MACTRVATSVSLLVLFLIASALGPSAVFGYENPYLYGIHDHEPQPTEYLDHIRNVIPGGWVTATVAVGHDEWDMSGVDFTWYANQGVTVICRMNNGYFPNGTIPPSGDYASFAKRCANFVQNSPGCEIWVIGNELNIAGEWPLFGGRFSYVSPWDYANCFRQVYNAIKAVRPNHKVIPAALAPWSGPFPAGYLGTYPHDANPSGCCDYLWHMLTAISASGPVDGIALHVNSRGYAYSDIHSTERRDNNGRLISWSFYIYKDWINLGIPPALYNLPIYITECNGYYYWKGGHPESPSEHYEAGWMQEVYKEIDSYNRTVAVPSGKPVIRCINMYRWAPHYDHWNIDGANPYKAQILSDLDAAVAFEYTWPGSSIIPDAWSDDFNDGWLDDKFPEPDWTSFSESGGARQEADGYLKLTGTSGSASRVIIRNSEYRVYKNFIISTKLCLADAGSTAGNEGNAEIRFRADADGVGYGLSFRPNGSPNTISLRRTDTGAVVQSKEVNYDLPSGTCLYVRTECDGARITIQVGTSEGASDVINWDFTDSTFPSKGCFWLVNNQMLDVRFDYFNYGPSPRRIEGIVRDSLGSPIGGVTVSTNTGGYSVTTAPDGTYAIPNMTPGIYDVTASKANYTPQTVTGVTVSAGKVTVDFTITDATRPEIAVVTDAGAYQTTSDSITFSYTSSDSESPIMEYLTAVSSSPSLMGIIIPEGKWVSVGLDTTHTRTGLSLTNGQNYYGLVRARNAVGVLSYPGYSDGIKVAKAVASVGLAKCEPDGLTVALEDRIVTASFSDRTYIEDPDRTSGIRISASGIAEGAVVDLAGRLATVNGERQIWGCSVTVAGTADVPDALGLANKALGGGPLNQYTPGVTGGEGANNIGLLVTTWGRVTQAGSGYFVVNDGSSSSGLKVTVPSGVTLPSVGADVIVTGISSVESDAQVTPVLHVRKQEDIYQVQ